MSTTTALGPSLRELNKERTREALAAAAVQLLTTGGVDAVTAHSVAQRAGVSRRTFFNYFPRVEDVLTETCRRATRRSVQLFLARPADEPLADAVRSVLHDMLNESVAVEAAQVERAALASPAIRAYLREYQEEQANALAQGLSTRLGAQADPVWVAAFSGSIAAVVARVPRELAARGEHLSDIELAHQIHAGVFESLAQVLDGFLPPPATSPLRQD